MISVTRGGWYRDGQGMLWLDAEPVPNSPNFILYRSGAAPRLYTPDGVYLNEQLVPEGTLFNLVLAIDRAPAASSAAADPAINDHSGVFDL